MDGVLGPVHHDLDELGRPLPVDNYLLGQLLGDVANALPEGRIVIGRLAAGHAVGQEHRYVIGALVPVDADHVETDIHHVLPAAVEVLAEVGVGDHERERGGVQHLHGRGDHPAALGYASYGRHRSVLEGHPAGGLLLHGVGGHYGPCGQVIGLRTLSQRLNGLGYAGGYLIHGQEAGDYPGGGHAHEGVADAQGLGGEEHHLLGIVDPLHSGDGVGVAAVDHQGLQGLGVLLHHDLDRRRPHLVLGVGDGAFSGYLGIDDRQIELLLLYPAMHPSRLETLRRGYATFKNFHF